MTHEERRQKTIKISAKPFDKGATDEDGGTLNICNSSCLPLSYNVLFLHSSNNITMKHIVLFVNCYIVHTALVTNFWSFLVLHYVTRTVSMGNVP